MVRTIGLNPSASASGCANAWRPYSQAQDDQETYANQLLAIKIELRRTMHDPIAKTGDWIKRMLQGRLNYFAVSGNHPSLRWFFKKVRGLWLMALRRRSQTARLSWEKFIRLVAPFFRQSGRYMPCRVTASTLKPEGGARCVSSARRDLCGGRGPILVPTATL